ncbi:MAG: hypothetical protein H6R33_915 [Actinobacteria bacterium]|nr:hypothetical protein [Actinomycetota bacterium]
MKGGSRSLRRLESSAAQAEEDFLGAPDGEGGDHHDAAAPGHPVDDRGQGGIGVQVVGVVAPAVGGLQQQQVRPGRRLGVLEHRDPPAAHVPGEDQAMPLDFDSHMGGAEDVAGVGEAGPTHRHREPLVVWGGPQQPQGTLGVLRGVEGQRRVVAAVALAVQVLGSLLLKAGGVGQHHPEEVRGGRRSPHRPLVGVTAHQAGQVAAVVDVGVGQQHLVGQRGAEGRVLPVELGDLSRPLEHAAVHEQAAAARRQQELGAGDRVGAAKEGEMGHRRRT